MLGFARDADLPLEMDRGLELKPFDIEATGRQLTILLRGPVTPALLEFVQAKTGGIPFSIGQLVRHLHGSEALVREGSAWTIAPEPDGPAATLEMHEVLLQPIVQLPSPVQQTLGQAAICGSTFWADQLERVMGRPVYDDLLHLSDGDLVIRQPASRLSGQQEFAFRYEGLQRALYARVDPRTCRDGHEAAARWLCALGAQDMEVTAATADHLSEAGLAEEAAGLRAQLAAEAARWEREDAPPWAAWPDDTSPGAEAA